MKTEICIHGHFYQPPRENPWLETIELQETAHPYHNWNEKISAECYSQNSFSRILNSEKKIFKIINNYSYISFNIGPTLINWLEKKDRETYKAIIEADKISKERFSGHGSAIAQAYNHMIMPLANRKDKITQVKWGIADFIYHFERYPEGMWLPETAVDVETLEILAENNIKFTILAPHQAYAIKPLVEERWHVLKSHEVDTTRPYLCRLPSGNSIHIFLYNGAISHAVGFGTLLNDGKAFAERLAQAGGFDEKKPSLVNIATDGETFGHHHRFGDMALAFAINHINEHHISRLTIYGEFLEKYPVEYEIQINENTSWSCPHGVKRWHTNCGCNIGQQPGWRQEWRQPLRETFNWLRDEINLVIEKNAAHEMKDFTRARDEYIQVMYGRSDWIMESFMSSHLARPPAENQNQEHERKLFYLQVLEMQRLLMLMYTSCGWFFDDIGNIESIQVLRYAIKALDFFEKLYKTNLRDVFNEKISKAVSNVPEKKNALNIIEREILPGRADALRAGIHFAISLFYSGSLDKAEKFHYIIKSDYSEKIIVKNLVILFGRFIIKDSITLETTVFRFIAQERSEYDVQVYINPEMKDDEFNRIITQLKLFISENEYETLKSYILANFRKPYSINYLFKDEQARISQAKLSQVIQELNSARTNIFFHHLKTITYMTRKSLNIPPQILSLMSNVFSNKILELFTEDDIDIQKLEKYLFRAEKLSVSLYINEIEFAASRKIYSLMYEILNTQNNTGILKTLYEVLEVLRMSYMELDIWRVQNLYFKISESLLPSYRQKAQAGDEQAAEWVELFTKIGNSLKIA